MFELREDIFSGIEKINLFGEEYKKILTDEPMKPEFIEYLFEANYHVLLKIKSEKFRLIKLFGQKSENVSLIDTLINEWSSLFSTTTKLQKWIKLIIA